MCLKVNVVGRIIRARIPAGLDRIQEFVKVPFDIPPEVQMRQFDRPAPEFFGQFLIVPKIKELADASINRVS